MDRKILPRETVPAKADYHFHESPAALTQTSGFNT